MVFEAYTNKTVYEMMELVESQYGKQIAFTCQDDDMSVKQITYTQLWTDIRRLAGYFERQNLKGQYIVIDGRNTYEQIIAMFAAPSMGAVAVVINFDLSREDLSHALETVSPALVIYDGIDKEFVEAYCGNRNVSRICCTGTEEPETIRGILESGTGLCGKNKKLSPEDPALVIMTSGSTAHSKLVLLSHQAFLPAMADMYSAGEKTMLLIPLFHISAVIELMGYMARGCNTCLSGMKTGIMDMEWFHPNSFMSVPLFVYETAKRIKRGKAGYEKIRAVYGGGAPLSSEKIQFLSEKGIFCACVYGCTETALVTASYPSSYKPGSVGKPGAWNEVKLSEQGEILVKGKSVMLEYIGNPEATRNAVMDGWYHTGDIGYLDEDGCLFITGRINNIILFSNGENVSPEAIEAKLVRCPTVEEILVYGDREHEKILAKVWCGSGATEEKRAHIQAFVDEYNKTVPLYQQIHQLVFSQEPLPKTPSGKIKR